jgi:hypothetical protein
MASGWNLTLASQLKTNAVRLHRRLGESEDTVETETQFPRVVIRLTLHKFV